MSIPIVVVIVVCFLLVVVVYCYCSLSLPCLFFSLGGCYGRLLFLFANQAFDLGREQEQQEQ